MTLTTALICTAVGFVLGRRSKKRRRLCPHGVATDAVRCLSCAAARVLERRGSR